MITGDRLRFRAVEPEDLPTFLKWINDPEVRFGISVYLPFSMADEQDWYAGVRKHAPDERSLVIEVRPPGHLVTCCDLQRPFSSAVPQGRSPTPQGGTPTEPGGPPGESPRHLPGSSAAEPAWKMIGSTGFFNLDYKNRCAELGIMIGDKSCWNQGYGTEAVRLLVQHGFHTLNLNRIYLRVLENNPRAIRAYEKAGFTHEGRQRQAEFKDGQFVDLLVMSILKEEFL